MMRKSVAVLDSAQGLVRSNWSSPREYLDWLSTTLGIQTQENWYKVNWNEVKERGGCGLIHTSYKDSLYRALSDSYREFLWHEWKFEKVPHNFWDSIQNQRKFFDWISEELGIENHNDWFGVSAHKIKSKGGSYLMSKFYSDSIFTALHHIYPEFQWNLHEFPLLTKNPKAFHEQRKHLDWIADVLKISTQSDWYHVKASDIIHKGGVALLYHYGKSHVKALNSLYPEFFWKEWMFVNVPDGHWKEVKNRRKFLDWFAEEHDINTQEEWYLVKPSSVKKMSGKALMNVEGMRSLPKLLEKTYGEFSWYLWKFNEAARQGEHLEKVHKNFFDWLSAEMGLETQDEWYNLSHHQIIEHGGGEILAHYNNYVHNAVSSVYPQYEWHFWKFKQPARELWKVSENQKKFLDWLAEKLKITKKRGWHRVRVSDVIRNNGGGLLHLYNYSIVNILSAHYPEHNWSSFQSVSDGQTHVWRILKSIINGNVLLNFKHPKLIYEDSKRVMELDIYIPSLQLAFEYQGDQHYNSTFASQTAVSSQQERDEAKRRACKSAGICLIEVPYWWQLSQKTLISTIRKYRPEVKFDLEATKQDKETPHAELYA